MTAGSDILHADVNYSYFTLVHDILHSSVIPRCSSPYPTCPYFSLGARFVMPWSSVVVMMCRVFNYNVKVTGFWDSQFDRQHIHKGIFIRALSVKTFTSTAIFGCCCMGIQNKCVHVMLVYTPNSCYIIDTNIKSCHFVVHWEKTLGYR